MRAFETPIPIDLSGPAPYTEIQKLYDPFFPDGELCYYWKSTRLARLDDEVVEAVTRHASERASPRTLITIWHQGGAMSQVRPGETAFGDRSAPFLLSLDSTWEDPEESEVNISWTRKVWKEMQRFSTNGTYLNFPGMGEEGEALVRASYGSNYERLARIKAKLDPDNLFRLNQNIRPRG